MTITWIEGKWVTTEDTRTSRELVSHRFFVFFFPEGDLVNEVVH